MCQYVTKIDDPRPTPISMEECETSDMGKYDLIFAMSKLARKMQRTQVKSAMRGDIGVREMKSPIIMAMTATKDMSD